jgi:hypothetical protein
MKDSNMIHKRDGVYIDDFPWEKDKIEDVKQLFSYSNDNWNSAKVVALKKNGEIWMNTNTLI